MPKVFGSDEFSSLRYQIKIGFETLISATQLGFPALNLPRLPEDIAGDHDENNDGKVNGPRQHFPGSQLPSRYQEEFIEIKKLGRGGFGRVVEARNALDGKTYAVKSIDIDGLTSS